MVQRAKERDLECDLDCEVSQLQSDYTGFTCFFFFFPIHWTRTIPNIRLKLFSLCSSWQSLDLLILNTDFAFCFHLFFHLGGGISVWTHEGCSSTFCLVSCCSWPAFSTVIFLCISLQMMTFFWENITSV